MRSFSFAIITTLLTTTALLTQAAHAQDVADGGSSSLVVATIVADEVDLGDDDTVRSSRSVIGASFDWSTGSDLSLGVEILGGRTSYEFSSLLLGDTDLDVDEFSVALPVSFGLGESGRIFLSPSLTFQGEDSVSFNDGVSYGLIAGIGWQISPTLFIGPGIGVASTLVEDDDAAVFPFLVLDWQITDQWSLGTGSGFAASRGPGLRLAYKPNANWELGVEARLEEFEFSLDDESSIPNGVGRDSSTPVFLTARYQPSDNLALSGFVGASAGGSLEFFDEDGRRIFDEDYDTAPLLGFAVTFSF